jgi:hypothetical protein
MLDMMMANSPEGFSVGEVHALFRPFRPHHFKPECGCGNSECDFWLKVRDAGEERLYETIFNLLPDVSFIVDSSKDPWWIQKQAENLLRKNIEIYHLLIWKEPAAFAHSMIKRNRKGWGKAWKNYYRLYFTLIDDYISVPYSDLAQYPDQILQDLCRKCGLQYHQGKEEFWQKHHHTLFGNDSAKIHLRKDCISNFDQFKEKQVQPINNHEHRSIYHDTSYLHALPPDTRSAIEADPDLQGIMRALNNQIRAKETKTACYTAVQLAFAQMRWGAKAIAGRIIGRYSWIF